MTHLILKIACTAIVLIDKDCLPAFRWNWEECGFSEAVESLGDDVRCLTHALEYAKEDYWADYR